VPCVVEGGREALAALEQAKTETGGYPLVILDAHMPGMDGFELAEHIRRDPSLARATILMLTSDRQREDVARCRQMGIAAYLTKPVMEAELLQAVLHALGRAGQQSASSAVEPVAADLQPERPLRILLAEDNPVNRLLVRRMLEKRGHSITVASHGREVLRLLEDLGPASFDLLLMDVQMPELDGFETTGIIRQQEKVRGGHLPVIAVTAHALKGDPERCRAAGMDGYVSKPVGVEELLSEILRCATAGPAAHPHRAESSDNLSALRNEKPAGEGILDREALLNHFEGDTALLGELIGLFLEDSPRQLAALRASAERGDVAAFLRDAHTFKGTLGNFSAPAADAAARALEAIGRRGDLPGALQACVRLEAEIEALKPLLLEMCREVAQ